MNSAYEYMKCFWGLLVFVSCVASGSTCRAQLDITLDTATVSFGTLDKTDLDAGFVEMTAAALTYAVRVTVTDTVPQNWTLYTKTATTNFTAAVGVKPCGDLQWRQNGVGSYTAYTTSDVAAATGNGNGTVDFDFKILTSWSDKPDTYDIDVVFTISN